ncbi:MAG: efflux RND transporter periplasmic adaptor subunit [Acidobacteriota bacterium]
MTTAAKTRLSIASLLAVAAILAIVLLTGRSSSADPSDSADQTTDETSEAAETTAEDGETETPVAIPVAATEAVRGPVSAYLSATANLVAEKTVEVLTEAEGRVARLTVDEGDLVTSGQVLAELAADDEKIAVEKARVRAETARHAFERAERLRDQELLADEEFESTALSYRVAQQELAEAEVLLGKTRIRAPFAGRVTQRTIQLGQHVRPGDALFTIADFEPLVARIYLPERDVLALDEGRSVRLVLRADDAIAFDGTIRQISPVVDTATGTVKVTVESRRPPAAVRPGAFVRVDIVRETRSEAVLLPREAVLRELREAYVFVATDDGVAERRAITLGLEENGRVEAVDGVAAGEKVIVAGQGGLEDGAAIRLIEAS